MFWKCKVVFISRWWYHAEDSLFPILFLILDFVNFLLEKRHIRRLPALFTPETTSYASNKTIARYKIEKNALLLSLQNHLFSLAPSLGVSL